MSREVHVRFWESARVRLPRATHLPASTTVCSFGKLFETSYADEFEGKIVDGINNALPSLAIVLDRTSLRSVIVNSWLNLQLARRL